MIARFLTSLGILSPPIPSAKESGELLSEIRFVFPNISYLTGLPSGRIAIVFSDDQQSISVCNPTRHDAPHHRVTFSTGLDITSLAASPDYDHIAVGHRGCLTIWNAYSYALITTINIQESISSFLREPANRLPDFLVEEMLIKQITDECSSEFIVWTAQGHLIVGCTNMLAFFDIQTKRCIALITSEHVKHNAVHLPDAYLFRRETLYKRAKRADELDRLFILNKANNQCVLSAQCSRNIAGRIIFYYFADSSLYTTLRESYGGYIHVSQIEDSSRRGIQKVYTSTTPSESIMPLTIDGEHVFTFERRTPRINQFDLKKQADISIQKVSSDKNISRALLLNNGSIVLVAHDDRFTNYALILLQYRCIRDYCNYLNDSYNKLLQKATDNALLPPIADIIRQYTNPTFSQMRFFKQEEREAVCERKELSGISPELDNFFRTYGN